MTAGKGLALQWLLSQMDGERKSSEIAARLVGEFSDQFPDRRSAERFIKGIITRYS